MWVQVYCFINLPFTNDCIRLIILQLQLGFRTSNKMPKAEGSCSQRS
jgi:hypothetical protein